MLFELIISLTRKVVNIGTEEREDKKLPMKSAGISSGVGSSKSRIRFAIRNGPEGGSLQR